MTDKKTIGFVVSGIMDEFVEHLCKGVISAAEKENVNVVVIPVKYIDREMKGLPDVHEYQYQTNIKNITYTNVDVLIVSIDTIDCLSTEEGRKRFMDELEKINVPIILTAAKMDGYPGVVFDNKTGINEGMKYLIEELGVKNICMLKTRDHNNDGHERYEAYRESMEKYGLTIGPNSVLSTNLSRDCKEECEWLIDNNPDMEAVICANDDVALTFYDVMSERGLVPGKDIKVMGFDNSVKGSMITPSLSTVDASGKKLGHIVFKMVRMMLEGWSVGQMTVPTRFIPRDSFGSLLDKDNVNEQILDKDNLDKYFHRVFFKFDDVAEKEHFDILIEYKTLMNILIDYIDDATYNPDRVVFLKNKLDEFFNTGVLDYTDTEILLAYVDRVRAAAMERFASYERKCQAYETYSMILDKIIRTMRNDAQEYENIMNESLFTLKTMVEDTLNFNQGNDESYANIVKNLSIFGVKNAYVYIYDEPIVHKQFDEFVMPDNVRLKVAMTGGRITCVPEHEQEMTIDHLFNNKFITNDYFNMILMPLYFKEKLYGSVLYDLTDVSYRSGDFLANQYATVARVIDVLKHSDVQ